MDVMSELEVTKNVLVVVMTQQYTLNAGLKKLNDGEASVTKELSQLHVMNKFTTLYGLHLRKEEKKDTITSLMLLTKKRRR